MSDRPWHLPHRNDSSWYDAFDNLQLLKNLSEEMAEAILKCLDENNLQALYDVEDKLRAIGGS